MITQAASSFDIEAAVRDGKLDVGVFARESHLKRLFRHEPLLKNGSVEVHANDIMESIFTRLKEGLTGLCL